MMQEKVRLESEATTDRMASCFFGDCDCNLT